MSAALVPPHYRPRRFLTRCCKLGGRVRLVDLHARFVSWRRDSGKPTMIGVDEFRALVGAECPEVRVEGDYVLGVSIPEPTGQVRRLD